MITIHEGAEESFRKEQNFELFRHNGYLCCVVRIGWSGCINGYVAVTEEHSLFGKSYSEHVIVKDLAEVPFNGNYIGLLCHSLSEKAETNLLSLDLAIKVHGGLTYSEESLPGIEKDLFGILWWFGFDTAHAGDLRPLQTDIDRKYPISNEKYRSFNYVKKEVKSLAEQLSKFAAIN